MVDDLLISGRFRVFDVPMRSNVFSTNVRELLAVFSEHIGGAITVSSFLSFNLAHLKSKTKACTEKSVTDAAI